MNSEALMRGLWLPLLLFSLSVGSLPLHDFDYTGDSLPVFTYDRFSEVKHHCAQVLPVIAELRLDDTRGHRISNELRFNNGDWSQAPDAVPLIPGTNKQNDEADLNPSTKLASFLVMDVESLRPADNMISVSGVLEMSSGSTKIRIFFEGVYVESDENGGQRHMCMLATSWMPDSDATFNHLNRLGSSFALDDQIMLHLRYPKTFTLTTRGIYGEMKSLSTKPESEYFGEVSISSQLVKRSSTYQFGSAEVLKVCSPYKDSDTWFYADSVIFTGKDFCNYFQGISMMAEFQINPNHTSFAQHSILDSFVLDRTKSRDINFGNFKLIIRNSICQPGYHGFNTANVAAEFTASLDHSQWNISNLRERSGLSGKSIFAEGTWSSSERELCMVDCLGGSGEDSIICDHRVTLFFPTAFSIHRRSMVYGSITNIKAQSESDATISFETVVSSPSQFLNWARFYNAYDYSKLSLASALKSRHQLASLVGRLRRTLFEYPSYFVNNQDNLRFLPGDLTVRSTAVVYNPKNIEACKNSEEFIACSVLSVDLLFGSQHIHISPPAENQDYSDIRTVALSGYLSITGRCFSNVSLSVEGLYDPTVGTMHLIGCRDLRSIQNEHIESLEQGQDCKIEIEVQYPPANFRWLMNQKLRISISSQREKQDSLYVSPSVIWTQPIAYSWQLAEKEFIKAYERRLKIIMLLVTLYCTIYQLRYINSAQGEASSSYISLVMLSILIPFITGLDDLNPSGDTISIIKVMLYMNSANTFGLIRRVRTSRTRPNFAREIKVLAITLSIHLLGLAIFLNHATAGPEELPIQFEQIEIYWGLVQDLFWLPQIIANRLWEIKSEPLRKIYYIGLSLVKAFPHLYNYFRDPPPEYATTKEDQAALAITFLNRFSDLAIAMTMFLFAFVVYIQQRQSSGSHPEAAAETESLEEEKRHL